MDLEEADLTEANPQGAPLWNANLRGADLQEATLDGWNLQGADIDGANLSKADFEGADLHSARNLTCEQLTSARNWELAYRDEEIACGAPIPEPPLEGAAEGDMLRICVRWLNPSLGVMLSKALE